MQANYLWAATRAVLAAALLLTACPEPPIDCPAGATVVNGTCQVEMPDGTVTCGPGQAIVDGACTAGGGAETLDAGDATVADTASPDVVMFDVDLDGCIPSCEGRACGDDGCGGNCGGCDDAGLPYCVAGACVAQCTSDCTDKGCGDDGCGGSCGECGDAGTCSSLSQCVTNDWTCTPSTFDDGAYCDCDCGVVDPDCANAALPVKGCAGAGATCSAAGECEGGVVGEWICDHADFEDGLYCNCNCGLPDPDCADPSNAVFGCASAACGVDGTCGVCAPQCDGLACGPDGCGGQCGTCDSGGLPYCDGGVCTAECTPNCVEFECGSDGCGGFCGTCPEGETCYVGACAALEVDDSCVGSCGR